MEVFFVFNRLLPHAMFVYCFILFRFIYAFPVEWRHWHALGLLPLQHTILVRTSDLMPIDHLLVSVGRMWGDSFTTDALVPMNVFSPDLQLAFTDYLLRCLKAMRFTLIWYRLPGVSSHLPFVLSSLSICYCCELGCYHFLQGCNSFEIILALPAVSVAIGTT